MESVEGVAHQEQNFSSLEWGIDPPNIPAD